MNKMVDTGIPWLGSINEKFQIKKLKYIADILDQFRKPITADKRNQNAEILYDYYGASGAIDKIDGYTIDDHVMLIGEDGANLRMRNLPLMYEVNGKAWINNHAHILKPKNGTDFYYLFYALESIDINPYVTGSAQPKLNQENLKEIVIPFPPFDEQKKIADFLDEKCGEIDSIKADVQRQIELLNDYKKSVITEAVTKGLNPKAKLKDSGIEWVGKIPEHWKVEKFKYHLNFSGLRNPGNVEVLSLYRELGIVPKNSRTDNFNQTSEDTSNYRYVRIGDFVINKMKAWQGSVAVSDYNGIVSPAYFVYSFSDEVFFKRYFHYLLRNKTYATEFKRLSGGIRVGQWDLPREALENILVPIPPLSEQKEIANYLDEKCSEIDAVIADKQKQLETLDEYKKSLIFEYVTGKKEVI